LSIWNPIAMVSSRSAITATLLSQRRLGSLTLGTFGAPGSCLDVNSSRAAKASKNSSKSMAATSEYVNRPLKTNRQKACRSGCCFILWRYRIKFGFPAGASLGSAFQEGLDLTDDLQKLVHTLEVVDLEPLGVSHDMIQQVLDIGRGLQHPVLVPGPVGVLQIPHHAGVLELVRLPTNGLGRGLRLLRHDNHSLLIHVERTLVVGQEELPFGVLDLIAAGEWRQVDDLALAAG